MKKHKECKSALSISEGIAQPPSVSEHAVSNFRQFRKKKLSPDEYSQGILDGNRIILSRAITLVESNLPSDYQTAQEIIEKCLPHSCLLYTSALVVPYCRRKDASRRPCFFKVQLAFAGEAIPDLFPVD